MYVYIRSGTNPTLWVVGFYRPDGIWEPESDHISSSGAAERVHWLNGGVDIDQEIIDEIAEKIYDIFS